MSIIDIDNNLPHYTNPIASTYINEYVYFTDDTANSKEGDLKYIDDSLYVYKNEKYCKIETTINIPDNNYYDPITEQIKDWYVSYRDTQVNELSLLNKYPEARKAREIYENILKNLMAMEAITDEEYVE